jgi:hypothetical protein
MVQARATLQHHRTIFDGWRSISISLYMALAGLVVYGMMYLRLRRTIPALADAS